MRPTRPLPSPPDGADALLGDGRVLADLLRMAGPDTAPALLRQIRADLDEVCATLAAALAPPDWSAIRAQSHVLIALAGTVGATRLHGLALDLNTAAHNRAADHVARIAPPLLADLAALARQVANHPAGPA